MAFNKDYDSNIINLKFQYSRYKDFYTQANQWFICTDFHHQCRSTDQIPAFWSRYKLCRICYTLALNSLYWIIIKHKFIFTQFIKIIQQDATMFHNIIPYLYEAQHVSGDPPPHHQEPKTALAASGFSYVEGCRTCSSWTLSGRVTDRAWQHPPTTRPTTFHVCKTRGCQCSFRLPMMGGVLPETCWASYKYGIIKLWYILHPVGFFFMDFTMMHGSTNIKFIFTQLAMLLFYIM